MTSPNPRLPRRKRFRTAQGVRPGCGQAAAIEYTTQNCSHSMTVQSSTTVTDFKVRLFLVESSARGLLFIHASRLTRNDEKQPCLPSVSSVRRRRRRADARGPHLLPLLRHIFPSHVEGPLLAAQRGSPSSAARVVKRCAVFAAARRMCCRRLVDGTTCSGLSSPERVRTAAASVVNDSGELSDQLPMKSGVSGLA